MHSTSLCLHVKHISADLQDFFLNMQTNEKLDTGSGAT